MIDLEKVINQIEVDIQRAERTGEMLVHVGRRTAKDVIALLKEQDERIERLERDLAVTQNNLNYYVNGND